MVAASYADQSRRPCVVQAKIVLPLTFFCDPVPPVKSSGPGSRKPKNQLDALIVLTIVRLGLFAAYKLVIETNRTPPQITHIFEDILASCPNQTEIMARYQSGNFMGFRYHCGTDVGIVASKNGCRYQIQSDKLEAMWLLVEELCSRLTAYHADHCTDRRASSFSISIQVERSQFCSDLQFKYH